MNDLETLYNGGEGGAQDPNRAIAPLRVMRVLCRTLFNICGDRIPSQCRRAQQFKKKSKISLAGLSCIQMNRTEKGGIPISLL
jgi:hypothetical protein